MTDKEIDNEILNDSEIAVKQSEIQEEAQETLETLQAAASIPTDSAGNSYVSLVADPYGFKNIEISDAQNDQEPLTLDEPLDEDESSDDEFSDDEDSDDETSAIDMSALREQQQDALDDFKIEDDNGTLDRLALSISESVEQDRVDAEELVAKAASALADWTPDAETRAAIEAAEQLATQIAEDQELQAELALSREIEESEEAEAVDPALAAALPQTNEDGSLDLAELQSCIEAILFMVDKPMSMDRIRELIGPTFELNLFQEAMSALMDKYKSSAHGVEVTQVANGYQFRTKPGRAALAKKLAKVQTQRLSSGAMESLAIVAYKQPVLKDDIDKIRGVDSSYFIRQLLDKKLIHISGRSELVGRPLLYGTTDEFLSLFNLKDLAAMPSLREIEQMVPSSQSANPDDEDPRVKEMRKLVGQMKSDTSVTLIYDAREDEKILKDIREKVNAIPTSTPSLDAQKEAEKAAADAAKAAKNAGVDLVAEAIEAAVIAAPEGTTAEMPLQT